MKWASRWRGLALVLLFVTVAVASSFWLLTVVYRVDLRPRAVLYQLLDPPENEHVGVSKRVIIRQLQIVQEQLSVAFLRKKPPTERVLSQIQELIQRIEPQFNVSNVETNSSDLDVCPELYFGNDIGYPYFLKGWVMDNCTNAPPLADVISIVLYPDICRRWTCFCDGTLVKLLDGIHYSYPSVRVYVAVQAEAVSACVNVLSKYSQVAIVQLTKAKQKPGQVWNQLVKRVKTPYILIGRDMDTFTWFAQLERQIRVISTMRDVQVVGGAFRNLTGHWQVGCYQLDAQNYVLKYQDGYFVSKNECMFCDHLLGPFVARTEVLVTRLPFDESLPASVLFEDFFLRLGDEQMHAMVCPDSMYFSTIQNASEKMVLAESWVPLAKKWHFNRIMWPNSDVHVFSCEQAGVTCDDLKSTTKFYLMPICCIEQFARGVRFMRDFFANHSLDYFYTAGSVLGAVKMADLLPWDLDGDGAYSSANHSVLENARSLFKQHGLDLREFESPVMGEGGNWKKGGYFCLYTPNLYVEMYGISKMPHEVLPSDLRHIPTKINIHGVWVNSEPNPGLYARNRYGYEILKHAQSWIHTGKKSSWEQYNSGHFKPCPKHHYHACLDQFPPDGNLAFKIT